MECFDKVKKMDDKVNVIEKHLGIVSQTHQKMRDLQGKIIELDEWRSAKRDIPNSLPLVKSYDVTVCSMATKECQVLASWFEENARKDLSRMMDLYEKTTYDIQRYIQWPKIISTNIIQCPSPCSRKSKKTLKELRQRFKRRKSSQ